MKSMKPEDLPEAILAAVGAQPGDRIQIVTPQFTRTAKMTRVAPPPEPFKRVKELSYAELRTLGCEPWDEPDAKGCVLLLFPGEWYESIPRGFPIVGLHGEKESFVPGKTDDDIRFGCLAYGVRVKK